MSPSPVPRPGTLSSVLPTTLEKVIGEVETQPAAGWELRQRTALTASALSDIWVLLSVESVLITPVHSGVWLNYHSDFMEFFGVAIAV